MDNAARLQQLIDRQDILDCLTRFSRGMDRRDRALFLSAFHPDAVIEVGPFQGGPEQLYDWAASLHRQGQEATQHNLLNHSCEIEGNVSQAETYYLFVGRNHDQTNWVAGGRYLDRLERRDGQWKIARRGNAVEWNGMVPTLPLPFTDILPTDSEGERDCPLVVP